MGCSIFAIESQTCVKEDNGTMVFTCCKWLRVASAGNPASQAVLNAAWLLHGNSLMPCSSHLPIPRPLKLPPPAVTRDATEMHCETAERSERWKVRNMRNASHFIQRSTWTAKRQCWNLLHARQSHPQMEDNLIHKWTKCWYKPLLSCFFWCMHHMITWLEMAQLHRVNSSNMSCWIALEKFICSFLGSFLSHPIGPTKSQYKVSDMQVECQFLVKPLKHRVCWIHAHLETWNGNRFKKKIRATTILPSWAEVDFCQLSS